MTSVFAGHKVTSLDELKEGGAKMMDPPLQMCKERDEPMKIYCFDCSCLICRDCTINVTININDHFGHNHKFIKKAAPAGPIGSRFIQTSAGPIGSV